MAVVRYIVRDVDQAVAFYRDALGFTVVQQFGPAMAMVEQGDLRLWLAGPAASASRPMRDGAQPAPGGWNRFVITVDDIEAVVARLLSLGAEFRNEIFTGPGGRQVLCVDPSGNPVELFQPV